MGRRQYGTRVSERVRRICKGCSSLQAVNAATGVCERCELEREAMAAKAHDEHHRASMADADAMVRAMREELGLAR